jgi:hypothetical protein
MKKIIYIILFSLISGYTYAQKSSCQSLLYEVIKKQNVKPNKNSISFIDFTITTVVKNPNTTKEESTTENFKIYVSDKQTHLTSPSVSYFADDKSAFIVDHINKYITWIDVKDNGSNQDLDYGLILQTQKAIIDSSRIILCSSVEWDDGTDKIIIVKPHRSIIENQQIKGILYCIDEDNLSFVRIKIFYPENMLNISYTEYEYNDLQYDYGLYTMKSNINSYIFSKKDKLLPKFTNYKINDVRINK